MLLSYRWICEAGAKSALEDRKDGLPNFSFSSCSLSSWLSLSKFSVADSEVSSSMGASPSLGSNKTSMPISVAATLCSHTAYAETLHLNFGVYSHSKPSKIVNAFYPMLNELETRISAKLDRNVEIRIKISNEFNQSLSELETRSVDFARLYPSAYIEAKKMDEGIKILALQSEPSKHAFHKIIVSNSVSNINDANEFYDSLELGDAWVARANLDASIFEALQLSLLEIDSEDVLQKLAFDGFLIGNDYDYAAIREASEFTYDIFEKPLVSAESLNRQHSPTNNKTAFDAASAIPSAGPNANIAQQTITVEAPTLGAALPIETTGLPKQIQPINVNSRANGTATRSSAIPANTEAPEIASKLSLKPSNVTTEEGKITINIDLPKHLFSDKNSQKNSKTITINLSVPEHTNFDR